MLTPTPCKASKTKSHQHECARFRDIHGDRRLCAGETTAASKGDSRDESGRIRRIESGGCFDAQHTEAIQTTLAEIEQITA